MDEVKLRNKARYGLAGLTEVAVALNKDIKRLKKETGKGLNELEKAVENVKKALEEVRKECISLSEQKKRKDTVAKP